MLVTGDQILHAQLLLQLCQRISAHLLKLLHTGILKIANGHAHQLDSANGMYQLELYHHMIMIHVLRVLIQQLAQLIQNVHGKNTLHHQLSTQLHSAIHLWNLEPLAQILPGLNVTQPNLKLTANLHVFTLMQLRLFQTMITAWLHG